MFNVGFLGYNKGVLFGKILSQCSKQEAITEGIYQFKNDPYIENLLTKHGVTFEEVYMGYEDWFEFQDNKDGKLISKNPKFSTNMGMMKYMPKTPQPGELPNNMYLAGYYVSSTMGGASMEASCETGLNAGLAVVESNNISIQEMPYHHNVQYTSVLTIGLAYLDYILYKLGMNSLNNIIPSSILVILYLLLVIVLVVFIFSFMTKIM